MVDENERIASIERWIMDHDRACSGFKWGLGIAFIAISSIFGYLSYALDHISTQVHTISNHQTITDQRLVSQSERMTGITTATAVRENEIRSEIVELRADIKELLRQGTKK